MALFDTLWFIEGHKYWEGDLHPECSHRAASMGSASVRWHNVEVFALLHAMRHKHYVIVPDWWAPLEPPWVLLVSSPAFFAY